MRDGTVYLLHFDSPIAHAQHYIGFTQHINDRLKAHANGQSGVPLVNEFAKRGIPFTVARTWQAKQEFERALKTKTKSARRLCPICRPPEGYSDGKGRT